MDQRAPPRDMNLPDPDSGLPPRAAADGRARDDRRHDGRFVDKLLLVGLPTLILAGFAFWYAARFVEPAPPSRLVISSGSTSGGYYAFAQSYRKILARSGIDLVVLPSKGTVENLERLAIGPEKTQAGADAADAPVKPQNGAGSPLGLPAEEPAMKTGASVALVQGGVATKQQTKGLLSLGRMFYEPLWVFYRSDVPIDTLQQLSGKRIAIGPEGSGTRALALKLLGANNITQDNTTLLPFSGSAAAQALHVGSFDAMFVVASPKSSLVQALLANSELRLMSFARADAYARKFRFLAKLTLPRGTIDLVKDIPARDVHLIAPVAALVVRDDTHSALASLLAEAAMEVHGGDSLFQKAGDFPIGSDPVFAMSSDAKRIYKSGVPFLRRYLPFWMVVWVERLIVMLVPLLTILLPLMKLAPMAYQWQMRRRILRWYTRLKEFELEIETASDKRHLAASLAELDRIDSMVREISVPLEYTDDLYLLRQHIEFVRRKLLGVEEKANSPIG